MILAQRLRHVAAELNEIADALAADETASVQIGKGDYNRALGTVTFGSTTNVLTRSQAAILDILLDSKGVVVSRSEIMVHLHGPHAATLDSRSVDTHICTLRHILGVDAITTISGRGYRL